MATVLPTYLDGLGKFGVAVYDSGSFDILEPSRISVAFKEKEPEKRLESLVCVYHITLKK
ncbi:MAG: hypothetical protein ABIJ08_06660 [Nanoarchaeota archaeon]